MKDIIDLVVIGGGAAGFFAALSAKEKEGGQKICLLEKTNALLSKVRISGGGRCNVTHNCFDPKILATNYPRGYKELLPLFYRFGPKETIAWFAARGVELITEEDGRMFPKSESSQTIIDCFLQEARKHHVEIRLQSKILSLEKKGDVFVISLREKEPLFAKALILATGSSREGFTYAESLGHTIIPPLPSLFTFHILSFSLASLSGISLSDISLHLVGSSYHTRGNILITHKGLSGPATLKLSAFAARYLAEKEYKAELHIDWLPEESHDALMTYFLTNQREHPRMRLGNLKLFALPKSLIKALLERAGLSEEKELQACKKALFHSWIALLKKDLYIMDGKTAHKEEFVTCGGVSLKEVDFPTMQSKKVPRLFFCGEILDIDGITGGFNFQSAWTTAFLAGSSSLKDLL